MSVSGEGVNFQPSEVLALTYEFRRIFSLRSRGIFIWCTFLKKNEQDITSYIGYFRPKDIDKIPYVWYYNYKYEFFNEYCNKFVAAIIAIGVNGSRRLPCRDAG